MTKMTGTVAAQLITKPLTGGKLGEGAGLNRAVKDQYKHLLLRNLLT